MIAEPGSTKIAEPGSAMIAEPGSTIIVRLASYLAVPPSTRPHNPFVTGLQFENSLPAGRFAGEGLGSIYQKSPHKVTKYFFYFICEEKYIFRRNGKIKQILEVKVVIDCIVCLYCVKSIHT